MIKKKWSTNLTGVFKYRNRSGAKGIERQRLGLSEKDNFQELPTNEEGIFRKWQEVERVGLPCKIVVVYEYKRFIPGYV